MTLKEVMKELEAYGNPTTQNMYKRHGAKGPAFGVKVGDLKKIQKKIKKDHQLSIDLYGTGNTDAMYFAGLIADEEKISKADLNRWAKEANFYMISEYTVPWITAESPHAWTLGTKWIESKKENIASSGWATAAYLTALKEDADLDLKAYGAYLDRISKTIHQAPNRVRYTMNGFVISVGGNVKKLSAKAQKVADKIGKVQVDVGDTACKVPLATEYIQKMIARGTLGKKRKSARC